MGKRKTFLSVMATAAAFVAGGAFDASAAYYFLGLKGGLLEDKQLLVGYRGAQVQP